MNITHHRYLLNGATKVVHRLPTLEVCNGDAIKPRVVVEVIPEGYTACLHCMPEEEPPPPSAAR